MTSPVLQKYLEEFDKKGGNWLIHDEVRGEGKGKTFEQREKIIYDFYKSFLRSLVSAIRQETIEEIGKDIEKMKEEKPPIKLRNKSDRAEWLNDGYQLALSDLRAKLEKLKI